MSGSADGEDGRKRTGYPGITHPCYHLLFDDVLRLTSMPSLPPAAPDDDGAEPPADKSGGKKDNSRELGGSENPITEAHLPPTPQRRRSSRPRKRARHSSPEPTPLRAFVNTHGAQNPAAAAAANLNLDPSRRVLDMVLRADGTPEVMASAANRALDAAVNCEDPLLDDQSPDREAGRMALLRQVCLDAGLSEIDRLDPTTPYAIIVKAADLYVDPAVRPPALDIVHDENHRCSVCNRLKSHPVLLMCNHSFCFACLRVALNTSWLCPAPGCQRVQHRPPLPLPELEAELEETYVGFKDFTQVKLDWSGVRFPPRPSA
ncbi:hypothetical protein C8F01DRAFT_1093013 [Mycena amicta]|nr:hypothetical protein C8F01DRAFT_1092971 [Mycena amicta]KAJ7049814.1 hypothetical protein C8F01DRAFT_1093013 [Mycena amicta]